MATLEDVEQVRRNTNVDADDERHPYEVLEAYVDLFGISGASAKVWLEKAAYYADLCDVSEAGASERLGQLKDQAMEMALEWTKIKAAETGVDSEQSNRVKLHSLTRQTG
jgi:hypothetical protein